MPRPPRKSEIERLLREARRLGILGKSQRRRGPFGRLLGEAGDLIDISMELLSAGGGHPEAGATQNKHRSDQTERLLNGIGILYPELKPKIDRARRKAADAGKRAREKPEEWPEEHTVDTRRLMAPQERGAGIWADEVQTPESSNVYGFAYDHDNGILYVSYKSSQTRPNKDGSKPHVRGAMYSYGGAGKPVPPYVYENMIRTTSKGKFVWDRLRVRGTLWGHQYQYTLVSPDMAGGKLYVPRKATKKGLRKRAAVTVGRGKRPFDFSTRKARKS